MIPGTDLHQFDVHNDGYFAHLSLNYVDGVIFEMAVPRMPYEQLAEFLDEKCGCYFQGLYYQVPNQDLEMGLVRVSDDRSVSYMFDVENTFGRLNLYVDHLDMNLSEYLSQAITIDMDACVYKKIRPPKKRRCTVENDSEAEYESDDDSDYQSDKSVEYLSPGEEELIELRNRMKANRQAKGKAKDNQDPGMNEPNAENSMHADNVRGETFEEHDIYMNELLKSLKTPDKDGLTEDLFVYVEKHVDRSGEVRVVAKCGKRPPRLSGPEKDEHTCVRNFNSGALINYKWIAKIFSDKIRANLDIWLCDIADLVMKSISVRLVSLNVQMLRNSNPGSTVKLGVIVNPDGETYFDRFYVCFAGLADGWKAGCRKIIALDGFFLKSPNQGEILTAIGRDGNNHIYPVAWAVGLIEAVKDFMPNAEHMQCARHIYENFRKQYLGLEFRKLFWAASKASYPQFFNKIMDKIKSANLNAHKYLMGKNPKTWSRVFFEVNRGCEAIENGFNECFNSVIVNVRHKPLLTMLEVIKVIRLEWLKEQRRFWHVMPAGGNLFKVRSRSKGFTVDEGKRTCSCRMW
ncbi:hypothetical protein Tco_1102657 [Tanacetum coccineum]